MDEFELNSLGVSWPYIAILFIDINRSLYLPAMEDQ